MAKSIPTKHFAYAEPVEMRPLQNMIPKLLIQLLWCLLFSLLLLAPLVLIVDSTGSINFLSRLDVVWLILSSPEYLGSQIVSGAGTEGFVEFAILLARAAGSLALCWWVGRVVLGGKGQVPNGEFIPSNLLFSYSIRVVVGFQLLFFAALLLSLFSHRFTSVLPLLIPGVGLCIAKVIALGHRCWITRRIGEREHGNHSDCDAIVSDVRVGGIRAIDTLQVANQNLANYSWHRRLLGLSFLAAAVLFFQSLLATQHPVADVATARYSWNYWFDAYQFPGEKSDFTSPLIFRCEPMVPFWYGVDDALNRLRLDRASSSIGRSATAEDRDQAIDIVRKRYWSVQTSKMVHHVVMWCGFFVIATLSTRRFGPLCFAMVISLLGAFPSFGELSFFGRPEAWLIGCLAMICFALADWSNCRHNARNFPLSGTSKLEEGNGLKRYLMGANPTSLCILCLGAFPLCLYLVYAVSNPLTEQGAALESLSRVLGYSWIYPACWVSTAWVAVVFGRPKRAVLGATLCFAFVACLLVLVFDAPDRSWVPFIVLQSGGVAYGTYLLVSNQRNPLCFYVAVVGLLTAWLTMVAWPGIDHRVLNSSRDLLAEQNSIPLGSVDVSSSRSVSAHSASAADTEINYIGEMQRLWDERMLDANACVLIVGHWNQINVPFVTKAISTSTLIALAKRRDRSDFAKCDYIAIVNDSADEFEGEQVDSAIRGWLDRKLIEKVELSKGNRDLTLYRVSH